MEFSKRACFKSSAAGRGTLMDKLYSSRKQRGQQDIQARFLAAIAFVACLAGGPQAVHAITLSQSDALRIGKKIWQNECNGSVAGLTSWNEGENFASLGIGHFIWYPRGQRGPFEESFPKLVGFVSARGARLPEFLVSGHDIACPWNSRTEFLRDQDSPKMKQLRAFLVDTIDLQTQFLIARLEAALPKMLAQASAAERDNVQRKFDRLVSSPS